MWFEKNGKIIISLPGVPFEMKHIMEREALPRLKNHFRSDAIIHRTLFTAGEGESIIAEKIADIEASLPAHIKLAFLPDSGFVKLRLTGKGADTGQLTSELEVKQGEIAKRLGKIVIAHDDIPLEQILGTVMKEKGQTIGLAESCTGGYIGHYITQVPGASAYFMGSIVSYDNKVKENVLGVKEETLAKHGAVSEQTVMEMAVGALKTLSVDFALAVSGVLGPEGGTERVSVGTVWMAVASSTEIQTKEFRFFYDRERNKEMAAKNGMLFLWKFITGQISS